jgi:DNA-binding SARP family transcriptional activator/tetratricopeptide (TPR) repeat protein
MRFLVLGPVELWDDGDRVDLGGRKQRALLALLLLNANRNVPLGRLIDWLWEEEAPRTARELVHEYVSRLRRALRPNQVAQPASGRLRTSAWGYRLQVGPDELDLHRFERLVGEAQQAAAGDDQARAAGILRQALALWRGSPLEDVPSTRAVEAEVTRLEEARLTVLEQRIEADLQSGRRAELVSELEGLVAAEPLRECFRAQLMLVLYRCGRQAEALAVYRAGRRLLIDGHGLEPGSRLRELEQAILRDDPVLVPPSRTVARRTVAVPPPSQLPPDVADFTGRAGIMGAVAALLVSAPDEPEPAAPVVAVAGKPGVGKTALAVHVGHRLGSRFPDGQLWVDLRGVAPVPLDPAAALAGMLRALGVDSSVIPDELEERVRLYRSRLAGQRLLIVLDNAATEAQVRPLLPAGAGAAALVTSRCRLIGLEAAHHLDLDVLSQEEAVTLLGRVAGPGRLAADAEAARTIATLCGQLPLALRIVGAKLAVKRHWTTSEFVDRLRDEHRRLDELRAGDLEVRASVALSYQGRPPDEQRAFRLLGLLDTADFPAWAAAALLGQGPEAAEELLERLADRHLLEVAGRDAAGQARYRYHDLLRVYAREQLGAEEPPEVQREALERALAAWAGLAEVAAEELHPGYRLTRGAKDPSLELAHAVRRDPRAWLAAEHPSLVAGVGQAFGHGLWELTCRLAGTFGGICDRPGYWHDWQHTHELALRAARQAGDRRWEALLEIGLAQLQVERGRIDESEAHAEQAMALARTIGDRLGEAAASYQLGEAYREQSRLEDATARYRAVLPVARLGGDRHLEASVQLSLGMVAYYQGRLDDAAATYADALAGFRALADGLCTAGTLNSVGILARDQVRPEEAIASYQEALELFQAAGERRMHAAVLRNLAAVYMDQGRLADAVPALEEGLEFFSQLGDRRWQAGMLASLGDAHRLQGRSEQALSCYQQSLALCRELDYPRGEAMNCASLGRLSQDTGRREDAARWYAKGARLFHQIGEPRREAQSLTSLGETLANAGRQEDATVAWRQALAIFKELGAPEAAQVVAQLEKDDA